MTCGRCGGLAVDADLADEDGTLLPAVRCVLCGDYQDALIRFHRALPTPPEPARAIVTPVFRRRFGSIASEDPPSEPFS